MAIGREAMEIGAGGRAGARRVALVAGALAVLLAALWFFFMKGDDSKVSPVPASSAESAPATGGADEKDELAGKADRVSDRKNIKEGTKVAATSPAPVESFEVFAPKDPFDPLVAAAAESSSGDAGSDAGGGATSTGDHRVRLADLFIGAGGKERARVRVDDAVYRVTEGDVFADSFQLVSIDNGCATLLFGDDQFSLCEGEEIVK
ncbi:MAG: hypothetical protein ACRDJV_03120 [Actinomycetota bacterium]